MSSSKLCSKCGEDKPLENFHRQPSGKQGRHSWCAACFNERYRGRRRREHNPDVKSEYNLQARYGITRAGKAELLEAQGGVCAICGNVPLRPVVDHDHETGAVRGVLCHPCNIKLPAVEDAAFLEAARHYLEGK